MKWITTLALAALAIVAVACSQEGAKTRETSAETAAPATPTLAVLEAAAGSVLAASCADCHGEGPEARFSLTPAAFARTTVAVASSQIDTLALVDPGKPDRSYLLMKVTGDPRIQGKRMPIGKAPLGEAEVKAVADWIAAVPVPATDPR